ncbi:hypothetical protein DSO57_1018696 [Entomophthora muscae]|uniref:Uncharacterized protein n=1 Tax=Entomophthora muscae TaxID=34485 RepID=A0ACC2UDK0_9FUNG|nr:hypothetical protein DSO57_1018696 [Entomophthora muscae]
MSTRVQFKEDVERRQQIRDFILTRLFVSLSSQDNRSLVTIKLFAALIVLAFQEYQNGWTTFIEDILSAIDSAFPTQIERTELAKLQFLTLLSEEFETPRLGSINRANLAQYVGVEGRNVALRFIDRYTSIYDGQTSPDSDILREKGLNCLRNWVQFGIPSLELPQITDRLIQNFLWGGAHEICADVLHEILNHRNTVHVQDTIYNKLFAWLISAEMQQQVQKAISEEELCLSRSFMRVYASFGENFYVRVLAELSKVPEGHPAPQLVYLNMTLALTNYPGHFPTDQNISFTTLNLFQHAFP